MQLTKEEFKEQYRKAKTWGDADSLVEQLHARQHQELLAAMKTVQDYMGLDMRQEFYLRILKRQG